MLLKAFILAFKGFFACFSKSKKIYKKVALKQNKCEFSKPTTRLYQDFWASVHLTNYYKYSKMVIIKKYLYIVQVGKTNHYIQAP